jgi:hypothetical protein
LEGTEGDTNQPFWSPDGSQIGFFANGKLKKVRLPHGTPEVLCDVPTIAARGGAWSSKGIILFGVNYKGLMKIPENGGDPVLVAGLDQGLAENSLRAPKFLGDGNHFIYFSRTLDQRNHAVYLDALDSVGRTARKKLISADGPSEAAHDPLSGSDFLIFPKDGQLWAQRFDERAGLLAGEKFAVANDADQFSASATGTLIFRRTNAQGRLTWMDRAGKALGTAGVPGDYWDISLAPDERKAAVLNHRSDNGTFWVELIDLTRNLQSPFSDRTGRASGLVWSRDSQSLYFTDWGDKQSQIRVRRVDSADSGQSVMTSPARYDIHSLTPDGRTLVADHWVGTVSSGLGFAELGKLPWKVFESPSTTLQKGQFSPDGKWLLYQSNESGTSEIYLSDFPGLNIRRRLSASGGSEPRWGRNGKEIFFIAPGGLLNAVPIADPVNMTFGPPKVLLRIPVHILPWGGFSYDVTRNADRFIVLSETPRPNTGDLAVILNWAKLLPGE